MKKLFLSIITIFLICCTTACTSDKAGILFNRHPISGQNIYDHSKVFPVHSRIYYVVLMPKKVESRYLYIQIIKKDNKYGQLGYKLIQTHDVRLKDEEVNFYTDYFVLHDKGFYFMKVYSKDNPHKILTTADFYVGD